MTQSLGLSLVLVLIWTSNVSKSTQRSLLRKLHYDANKYFDYCSSWDSKNILIEMIRSEKSFATESMVRTGISQQAVRKRGIP